MSKANERNSWHHAMEAAFKALYQSLDHFGHAATLDLMVRLSDKDPIMNELLSRYPGIVTMGEFLARIPARRIENNRGRTSRIKSKR